ncbi:hypothetical protein OHA61_34095 [Streptomyces sp. NBC_00885]|uniref:hypothetical protein n=1 Tax=Streptomyces sp. NBC_00885 TaxID=2975857 RepID=UPI003867DCED|nr:hypothetical protein OHA61_34095 [Streptomyces sp. NBC_00885]
MSAKTLLTVYCGQCEAEGLRSPGKLGVVERTDKGTIRWRVDAPRLARLNRPGRPWRGWRGGSTLERAADSHFAAPKDLVALCPHHGRGHLLTADVFEHRGTVTLTMTASG